MTHTPEPVLRRLSSRIAGCLARRRRVGTAAATAAVTAGLQRPQHEHGNAVEPLARENALDQSENFTGEKGKGEWPRRAPGQGGARPRQGWKISPSIRIKPGETSRSRTSRARRHPAHLDDATGHWRYSILRMYWDGETTAVRRGPGGRLLRVGVGRLRAAVVARGVRQPAARSTVTGDAVPQVGPHHHAQPRRAGDDALLPDRLHADRRARGRRAFPRAVPGARTRCPTRRTTRFSMA